MIVSENITTYIHSLEKEPKEPFASLRDFAVKNDVPIIRREMESFIRVLLSLKNPSNILEIGAGIAYSALIMSNAAKDAQITTIENYAPRVEEAKKNIEKWGEGKIALIDADAAEVLPDLDGPYDFIFLDAAKGQYITFLPELIRLLPKGGILLADNVLQDGDLVMPRFSTRRRNRTIHDRMREFVRAVKHSDELETSLVTIGDGVTLSIKK